MVAKSARQRACRLLAIRSKNDAERCCFEARTRGNIAWKASEARFRVKIAEASRSLAHLLRLPSVEAQLKGRDLRPRLNRRLRRIGKRLTEDSISIEGQWKRKQDEWKKRIFADTCVLLRRRDTCMFEYRSDR